MDTREHRPPRPHVWMWVLLAIGTAIGIALIAGTVVTHYRNTDRMPVPRSVPEAPPPRAAVFHPKPARVAAAQPSRCDSDEGRSG